MALTLESVCAELGDAYTSPDAHMPDVCRAVSHGSLMGARGNSGRDPLAGAAGSRRHVLAAGVRRWCRHRHRAAQGRRRGVRRGAPPHRGHDPDGGPRVGRGGRTLPRRRRDRARRTARAGARRGRRGGAADPRAAPGAQGGGSRRRGWQGVHAPPRRHARGRGRTPHPRAPVRGDTARRSRPTASAEAGFRAPVRGDVPPRGRRLHHPRLQGDLGSDRRLHRGGRRRGHLELPRPHRRHRRRGRGGDRRRAAVQDPRHRSHRAGRPARGGGLGPAALGWIGADRAVEDRHDRRGRGGSGRRASVGCCRASACSRSSRAASR